MNAGPLLSPFTPTVAMIEPRVPPNPDFERTVRESFARQTMMASLGAVLRHVAPGAVTIALAHHPGFVQQHGFMHAGSIASIADSACGYAALSLAEPGADVLSVEFKINLLAPADAPHFEARGRVIRAGRTLTTCTADVYGLDGAREMPVATMLATLTLRSARSV